MGSRTPLDQPFGGERSERDLPPASRRASSALRELARGQPRPAAAQSRRSRLPASARLKPSAADHVVGRSRTGQHAGELQPCGLSPKVGATASASGRMMFSIAVRRIDTAIRDPRASPAPDQPATRDQRQNGRPLRGDDRRGAAQRATGGRTSSRCRAAPRPRAGRDHEADVIRPSDGRPRQRSSHRGRAPPGLDAGPDPGADGTASPVLGAHGDDPLRGVNRLQKRRGSRRDPRGSRRATCQRTDEPRRRRRPRGPADRGPQGAAAGAGVEPTFGPSVQADVRATIRTTASQPATYAAATGHAPRRPSAPRRAQAQRLGDAPGATPV